MSGEELFHSHEEEMLNYKDMDKLFDLTEEECFKEIKKLLDSGLDVNSHEGALV